MTQWCIAHPVMAFVLGIMLIITVDNAIGNVCRVVKSKRSSSPTDGKP